MYRYQILIEYVGTHFIGWQIQKKGKSIQKTKIVSKHQYPSSARAVYESIGIEQLVAPHNSLMAPRPGYVPKPQAPTGAPRRPQQFAGHNGRRVSESAKSSNNVETIDRPRTRGASRGASRDDTQTPQIDRPLGATQHGVQ